MAPTYTKGPSMRMSPLTPKTLHRDRLNLPWLIWLQSNSPPVAERSDDRRWLVDEDALQREVDAGRIGVPLIAVGCDEVRPYKLVEGEYVGAERRELRDSHGNVFFITEPSWDHCHLRRGSAWQWVDARPCSSISERRVESASGEFVATCHGGFGVSSLVRWLHELKAVLA